MVDHAEHFLERGPLPHVDLNRSGFDSSIARRDRNTGAVCG
jgi:hypothetical protein